MKLGAQLYTVRAFTQNAADFANTIKKVADIGYKTVQVSGIGPIPAREVADICAAHGIEIVITHSPPARIKDDTANLIADHQIMGAKYIGIGGMFGNYERTAAGVERFIADFAPAVREITAAGMRFMYHNHAFEFEKYDGGKSGGAVPRKLMLEYLMEGWPQAGFTLDTYWVQAGGADPAAWIKQLRGRVPCIHIKDMTIVNNEPRMAEVGEGNLNWQAIQVACAEAGVEHALVEQDDCYGGDPFTCLLTSYRNWQALVNNQVNNTR